VPNPGDEAASADFMEQWRQFCATFRIDADAAAAKCVGHLGAGASSCGGEKCAPRDLPRACAVGPARARGAMTTDAPTLHIFRC